MMSKMVACIRWYANRIRSRLRGPAFQEGDYVTDGTYVYRITRGALPVRYGDGTLNYQCKHTDGREYPLANMFESQLTLHLRESERCTDPACPTCNPMHPCACEEHDCR